MYLSVAALITYGGLVFFGGMAAGIALLLGAESLQWAGGSEGTARPVIHTRRI